MAVIYLPVCDRFMGLCYLRICDGLTGLIEFAGVICEILCRAKIPNINIIPFYKSVSANECSRNHFDYLLNVDIVKTINKYSRILNSNRNVIRD